MSIGKEMPYRRSTRSDTTGSLVFDAERARVQRGGEAIEHDAVAKKMKEKQLFD